MIFFYPNRPLLFSVDDPRIVSMGTDPNYDAEIKKNGTRLVLQKTKSPHPNKQGDFIFFNRQKEVLKYEPSKELMEELSKLRIPFESQLDGELMHFKTKNLKHTIYFYDVYVLSGNLVTVNLEKRREILKDMFGDNKFKLIHISKQYKNGFIKLFKKVITEEENEGLVIKDKRGIISFTVTKSPDVAWQIKIRKPTKNYKH